MATTKKHIFSPMEKKAFLDILKRNTAIIESKNTDRASLRSKNDAWMNMTREYNSSPYSTRPVVSKQLRRLWMNLKQRRRALNKERQHRLINGGRPSTEDVVVEPDVNHILPSIVVEIEQECEAFEGIKLEAPDSPPDIGSEEQVMNSIMEPHATPTDSQLQFVNSQSNHSFGSTSHPPLPVHRMPSRPPPTLIPRPPSQALPTPLPRPLFTSPPLRKTRRSLSPPSIPTSAPNTTFLKHKHSILEQEYKDRQKRANELHELEILLIKERIREAKAKADLADLHLQQQQCLGNLTEERGQED